MNGDFIFYFTTQKKSPLEVILRHTLKVTFRLLQTANVQKPASQVTLKSVCKKNAMPTGYIMMKKTTTWRLIIYPELKFTARGTLILKTHDI